jgi:hypothetical protein
MCSAGGYGRNQGGLTRYQVPQDLADADHPHWCTYWLTAMQRSPAMQHLHWPSWPHSVTPPQGLPLARAAPGKWQARVWLLLATAGGSALRAMLVSGGLWADFLLGTGPLVDAALAFFAAGGGGCLRKLAAPPAGGGGLRRAGDVMVPLLVPLAGGGPRLLPGGLLLMTLMTEVGGAERPGGLVLLFTRLTTLGGGGRLRLRLTVTGEDQSLLQMAS